MNCKPALCACWTITFFALLGLAGCQDYGFEELPSSVIREKRWTTTIGVTSNIDILFVMDNSRSMVGEQTAIAQSFGAFVGVLDEKFGEGKYRIAVITTGMESEGCQPCPADPNYYSCTNETGETGRFQDRLGHNDGTISDPVFSFTASDPTCRVMDSLNLDRCFFNAQQEGVIMTGINGCGYEKGLAPVEAAMGDSLINTWNGNFLRSEATLAVVIVSDEDDCGKVGNVTENIQGISGNACYYAAKGVAPNGDTSDPEGRPYTLAPVQETYDFLVNLKGGRPSMVKFATIVGLSDPDNPSATEITYAGTEVNSPVNTVCEPAGCVAACPDPNDANSSCVKYCKAYPGTRYVALAEMFGIGDGGNGFVSTICQNDFSQTLSDLGEFVSCPRLFNLSEQILDPGLANILINDVAVPRYSCQNPDALEECTGPDDTTCSVGNCVETWIYTRPEDLPPDQQARAPGGQITFADHYDPCTLITSGDVRIELIYVTE